MRHRPLRPNPQVTLATHYGLRTKLAGPFDMPLRWGRGSVICL